MGKKKRKINTSNKNPSGVNNQATLSKDYQQTENVLKMVLIYCAFSLTILFALISFHMPLPAQ